MECAVTTEKIERFLREQSPPTPFLVVDLDVVEAQYNTLRSHLPVAEIFYAVKANPAPQVISRLVSIGSNFDVASPAEIDLTLSLGATPEQLSYGNTIKKQSDIAYAYGRGVRLFAFDSEAELRKLAEAAPGSRVFCRLLVNNSGAEWPLSRKFGCEPAMARDLLKLSRDLGLVPYGVSFHVGSQQRSPEQWDKAVEAAAEVFRELEAQGVELGMVNLGGGLPAHYTERVEDVDRYALAINASMTRHFGNRLPRTVVEPGRYMVGDAGVLQAEVVLISRKSYDDAVRWIYLDVGRFSGLAETEGESIRYPVRTPGDGGETGPVVIAGPTCDSVDIMYEKSNYQMPLDLQIGDKVQFLSTGAYTTTYSSVGFNGFAPLASYYI
ncbi:MAG TPA: type III PLP-dependent enzyme [Alphaproteobacteria bacterium]|nr:type III PLP-dependent enzyme [Alphaproteobacteria bacterium]